MRPGDDRPGDAQPLGPPIRPAVVPPTKPAHKPDGPIIVGPDGKLSTNLPGPWGETA